MKFTLDQDSLSLLHKKGKLISHLQAYVAKTTFIPDEEASTLTFFFRGPFLQLSQVIPIEDVEGDLQFFEVDYVKFMNALSKMTFADEVKISVTEKQLRVSTEGSSDKIALGITKVTENEASSLIENLSNHYVEILGENLSMELDDEILAAFRLTHSLFNTTGNNNAIVYDEDSLMYADRSVVLQIDLPDNKVSGRYEIHKNILSLIPLLEKFSPRLLFSSKREFGWTDENSVLVIGSEPCDISVPSKDELEEIHPTDPETIVVDRAALLQALDFFSGFYEASSWKPITFTISTEGVQLEYHHPTSQLKKKVEVDSFGKPETFIVSSETLEKVLNADFDSEKVTIEYNSDGPGVRVFLEGKKVDSLLAKLIDNM